MLASNERRQHQQVDQGRSREAGVQELEGAGAKAPILSALLQAQHDITTHSHGVPCHLQHLM